MLKLSSLPAIAVFGCAILQPATAQTPGAAATEKSGTAQASHVTLKPTRAAPPASFSRSARPQHKHSATAAAALRPHDAARTQKSFASVTSKRAHTGRNATATAHSKRYANLRTNRNARAATSGLAYSPARAAPDVRARTAAARQKTMQGHSTNGLLSKRPKSG
jgi:hypothetical protein